jgi:senataxin
MLDTQYRSHPDISVFPRHYFYKGLLKDGPNVQQPSFVRPWYEHPCGLLRPYMFFNLTSSSEKSGGGGGGGGDGGGGGGDGGGKGGKGDGKGKGKRGGGGGGGGMSRCNRAEAAFALQLYLFIRSSFPHCFASTAGSAQGRAAAAANSAADGQGGKGGKGGRPPPVVTTVGVITPYAAQLEELKRTFKAHARQEQQSGAADGIVHAAMEVEVNTVDGFQGREKDIIIFSCVRAAPGKGVGFLNDIRRMNVALTRARYSLFVIGHAPALESSHHWRSLINHSKEGGSYATIPSAHSDLAQLRPEPIPQQALQEDEWEEEEEEEGEVTSMAAQQDALDFSGI